MRTIFIDRDGVINENRPDHVTSWDAFQFVPASLAALRLLTRHNFRICVVTNQAIINRHVVSRDVVEDIHRRMCQVALARGAVITEVIYCPHRPDEQCGCRKPAPGMLLSLARKYAVDLRTSYVIGDALSDVAAGKAAGCRTILTLTGRGREELVRPEAQIDGPDYVVANLWAAVQLVLAIEQAHPLGSHSTAPASVLV